MNDYDPYDHRHRTPDALAAAAEHVAGTIEGVDRALRELSDRDLEWLAEDAPPVSKRWEAMTMDEKRAWRAANEQGRRRRERELQERKAAEDAARQRRAVETAQAEARKRLRANFVGTDAEFEEAWPRLWARHRDRKALDGAAAGNEAALERKRRELGL